MKKNSVILLLLLISNLTLFSQSKYKPGFIISNYSDTIYGLINDFGEVRNAKKCYFKEKDSVNVKVYNPDELLSYRIIDGRYYKSEKIEIDSVSHQVFLECLLNGIYDLYYTNYLGKERYYIGNEEGRILELSNEFVPVRVGDKVYAKYTNLYIGTLRAFFADRPELFERVDRTSLGHKSLINITREYHELVCKDQECIIYEKSSMPVKFRVGLVTGVHLMNLTYKEEEENYSGSLGNNYFIGLIARLEAPRRNDRLTLEFTVDYSKLYLYKLISSETTFTDFNLIINQVKAKLTPKYIIPFKKFNLGFTGGVECNYYSGNEGTMVSERISGTNVFATTTPYVLDISPFQIGALAGLGLEYRLSKKILFLYGDIVYIPVKTETYIDSRFYGLNISTGIIF